MSKLYALVVILTFWVQTAKSQVVPIQVIEVSPNFLHFNAIVDDLPANDLSYTILDPEIGYLRKLGNRFLVGGSVAYTSYSGIIDPYEALALGAEARFYPRLFKPIEEATNRTKFSIRKRLGLYAFARYHSEVYAKFPENNLAKILRNGASGGIGYTVNLARWIALSGELVVHRQGPMFPNQAGVTYTQRFSFTQLPAWPKADHLTRPSAAATPAAVASSGSIGSTFAEVSFGYAPDWISEEENGIEDRWEHPKYYSVSGGFFLPKGIEVGASATLLDVDGSADTEIQPNEQFYLAELFGRINLTKAYRVGVLATSHVAFGNVADLNDAVYTRQNMLYLGFGTMIRYAINPKLYASGAFKFMLTTDSDRNTLALNHPEVRISYLWGE